MDTRLVPPSNQSVIAGYAYTGQHASIIDSSSLWRSIPGGRRRHPDPVLVQSGSRHPISTTATRLCYRCCRRVWRNDSRPDCYRTRRNGDAVPYMPPLYSFRISDPADILALSVFSIVGIAFSLFGGRRIALLTRMQTLTEELQQRVEEVETVLDVAPSPFGFQEDPHCMKITGNPMANRFYEAGVGENVSAGPSVPIESSATPKIQARRFFHNGIELRADELPMQQAVAQNRDVRNSELEVMLPSGRRINMLGRASPLRDGAGGVRGCVGAFLDITK